MTKTRMTVVVPLGDASALATTVSSLDHQTLPYSEFDVVFVGHEAAASPRLTRLADRRPNMRVSPELPAVAGEYALRLTVGDALVPDALERLHAAARAAGAAAVTGRRGGSAPVAHSDGAGPAVVAFESSTVSTVDDLDPSAVDTLPPASVVSVVDHPVLITDKRGRSLGEPRPVETEWVPTGLSLAVEGEGVAPVVVLQGAHGHEYLVPTTGEHTRFTAVIDVRTAANGEPLDDGPWHVALWPAASDSVVPLAASTRSFAVIDGTLLSTRADDGALVLEVGRVSANPCRPRPGDSSVVESATGTHLLMPLPQIYGYGDTPVSGKINVGSLPLPAQLVVRGGVVQLEALVSGLAGRYPLSTAFGAKRPKPTGLTLIVDGDGTMQVRRKPRPRQVPPPEGDAQAAAAEAGGAEASEPPHRVLRHTKRQVRRARSATARIYRRVRPR